MPPLIPSIGGAWCLMKATDMTTAAATNTLWLGAFVCMAVFVLSCLRREQDAPPATEVFNRMGEVILLMAAGYSNDWVVKLYGIPLGWVAACLALLSEFIRGLGNPHLGIMAAQRRMTLLAMASLGCIFEPAFRKDGKVEACMQAALTLIIFGATLTAWQRLRALSKDSSNKTSRQS